MPVQWWAKSPLEAIQTAKFNAPQMMMDARTAAMRQPMIPQEIEAARLANVKTGFDLGAQQAAQRLILGGHAGEGG